MEKLIFEKESYAIRGAIFVAYRDKCYGFLESTLQECWNIKQQNHNIPFVAKPNPVFIYKGRKLKSTFRPDLFFYDKLIVELKAIKGFVNEYRARAHNHLKSVDYRLGFLLNFVTYPKFQMGRIIN